MISDVQDILEVPSTPGDQPITKEALLSSDAKVRIHFFIIYFSVFFVHLKPKFLVIGSLINFVICLTSEKVEKS